MGSAEFRISTSYTGLEIEYIIKVLGAKQFIENTVASLSS